MSSFKVTIHPLGGINTKYNYVVIAALHKTQWVWVRKKSSITWELPGGHVENNEPIDNAARRELWEETGAIDYSMKPLCDFAIEHDGKKSFNRLFLAEVARFENLPSCEIEGVRFFSSIPKNLTHGGIQPQLLQKAAIDLGIKLQH